MKPGERFIFVSPRLTNAVHWVFYRIYQHCRLHYIWSGHSLRHRASASSLLWVCYSAHHPQRSQIRQRVSHNSSESSGLPVLAGMPESIFFDVLPHALRVGNLVFLGLSLLRPFAYPLLCLPFRLFPLLSFLSMCPGSLVVSRGKP